MDAEIKANPRERMTLLVVDDEAPIRELVKTALETMGLDCELARSGEEALELFSAEPARFAAVITDLRMPNMDGTTMVRRMRELAPGMKIIVASGSTSKVEFEVLEQIGQITYLPKPFTIPKLQECVGMVIGQKPPRAKGS